MDDTFALWLTVMMFSVMIVGVTFILTNRIVELRHRVNKLEIDITMLRKALEKPTYEFECPRCGHCCQQVEWFGLTDEEMKKTWYETKNIMGWYSFEEIARLVEAKLKEKNNG